MIFKYFVCLLLLFPTLSIAKLKVITSTTDIKWLVEQIGGNKVEVESLLSGFEDPHYVEAMPHFVGKAARADVFCLVGLELEIGWVPKVLSRSGNKKIQPGGKGYCETGRGVRALDVPKGKIDRSGGDVHASGNPHFHLGPEAFLDGGRVVLDVLVGLDPSHAKIYTANMNKLKKELMAIKAKVSKIVKPLKNKHIIEYHKEFTYFLKEFGLNNDGSLEEVPGVPPSAARLAQMTLRAKERNIVLLMASNMSPRKTIKKFEETSNVPVVILPLSIAPQDGFRSYPELLTTIAKNMVKSYRRDK